MGWRSRFTSDLVGKHVLPFPSASQIGRGCWSVSFFETEIHKNHGKSTWSQRPMVPEMAGKDVIKTSKQNIRDGQDLEFYLFI